jgi:hypothetical protein
MYPGHDVWLRMFEAVYSRTDLLGLPSRALDDPTLREIRMCAGITHSHRSPCTCFDDPAHPISRPRVYKMHSIGEWVLLASANSVAATGHRSTLALETINKQPFAHFQISNLGHYISSSYLSSLLKTYTNISGIQIFLDVIID